MLSVGAMGAGGVNSRVPAKFARRSLKRHSEECSPCYSRGIVLDSCPGCRLKINVVLGWTGEVHPSSAAA